MLLCRSSCQLGLSASGFHSAQRPSTVFNLDLSWTAFMGARRQKVKVATAALLKKELFNFPRSDKKKRSTLWWLPMCSCVPLVYFGLFDSREFANCHLAHPRAFVRKSALETGWLYGTAAFFRYLLASFANAQVDSMALAVRWPFQYKHGGSTLSD